MNLNVEINESSRECRSWCELEEFCEKSTATSVSP